MSEYHMELPKENIMNIHRGIYESQPPAYKKNGNLDESETFMLILMNIFYNIYNFSVACKI